MSTSTTYIAELLFLLLKTPQVKSWKKTHTQVNAIVHGVTCSMYMQQVALLLENIQHLWDCGLCFLAVTRNIAHHFYSSVFETYTYMYMDSH